MRSVLKLAPEPELVRGAAISDRGGSKTKHRGGLRTDKAGGVALKRCMIFETTGQYRIIRNGKPGPWQRGPAETP